MKSKPYILINLMDNKIEAKYFNGKNFIYIKDINYMVKVLKDLNSDYFYSDGINKFRVYDSGIIKKIIKPLYSKKVKRNKTLSNVIMGATIAFIITNAGAKINKAIEQSENTIIPKNNITEVVENNVDKNEVINTFSFEFENRTNSQKANYVNENYSEVLEKYAKMYGLDSKVLKAIAMHESGKNFQEVSQGGGYGLMQIQGSVCFNKPISAYNFETKQEETITVDQAKIFDLDYNVKVGSMIFANFLRNENYDIIKGIQCYNFGPYNMNKLMTYCQGKNLNNEYDWLNYRCLITGVDYKYVENVLSYIPDNSTLIFKKEDGNMFKLNIDNTLINDYSMGKVIG